MSRARDFADLAGSADAGGLTGANALINGQFAVAQRGTSFVSGANNDTDYTLDRWKLFSDGNDIVDVTQETSTVPTNRQTALALDVETANKKFGIAQIIEQKNCVNLIGGTVTLSFQAKVSATTNLDNVKAAIIAWDSTANEPTDDMISAWGVEGTNPTLASNFTYENTPANLNVTTSFATYSVTAAVDTANTKNIIAFIWSDVTTTSTGEFLYITDVKLEAGQTVTPYLHEDITTTFLKCQRYFETGTTGAAGGLSNGNGYLSGTVSYKTNKFEAATLGQSNQNRNTLYNNTINLGVAGTLASNGINGFVHSAVNGSASTRYTFDYTADAEL